MTDMAFVQRVLDSLPHAISAIDAEGRFAFANAAFWRMLDVPRAACPLGSPVRVLVQRLAYRGLYGPGDPQAQVEAVLAIDRSRPTRRLVTRPDGSRSVEILSVPLPEGGYVNIGHDVTALVHAREEQAARARLLESTLAELNSGLLRFDPAMRISFHNAAYEAMVGLPGGAVRPGMTHRELVQLLERHGQFSGNDEAEEVLEILERDRVTAATRERRRPSGKVLRFDVRPTSDGGCQVEVTDISALKRAEDEARRRAALLDGILAALPHGVCVYGPDRRVAMVNEAYRCIMHGSPLEVGEHIEDIAARRIAEGEFSADYAADVLAYPFGPNGRLGERVRHRRNGTAISIRGPMAATSPSSPTSPRCTRRSRSCASAPPCRRRCSARSATASSSTGRIAACWPRTRRRRNSRASRATGCCPAAAWTSCWTRRWRAASSRRSRRPA
jgi:PAS domain-containing protein